MTAGRQSEAATAAFASMDRMGAHGTPFLFVLDYDLERPLVLELGAIPPERLRYDLRGKTNLPTATTLPEADWGILASSHPPFETYLRAFALARGAFLDGESWLLNLTASSEILYAPRLPALLPALSAPYRIWVDGSLCGQEGGDGFAAFSPECFVRITQDRISTYPMKGSLRCPPAERDAAARRLLEDPKEAAEHVTVVDLLRNDLGSVSRNVRVPRYRYLEEIPLQDGLLLQTSSEVVGDLGPGWQGRIGQILSQILPAGSVTGAPKRRTCEHIAAAEAELAQERGYYTGVFGLFDGAALDSAVSIRFLEDRGPAPGRPGRRRGLFKSGGGLTVESDAAKEWRELRDKVALPLGPLLLETIRIQDGQAQRLEEHQDRIDRSHLACHGGRPSWRLADILPPLPSEGRHRLRLLHHRAGYRTEIRPYPIRRPRAFHPVEIGDLDYGHKYADRSGLEKLRAKVALERHLDLADPSWDIVLTRDGLLLEAGYGALACRLDGEWLTPASPALPSTRIAAYVKAGRIKPATLSLAVIPRMERILLVNAMLDLEDEVEVRIRPPYA